LACCTYISTDYFSAMLQRNARFPSVVLLLANNIFCYIYSDLTDVSGQHNGRLCAIQSNIQVQRTTKGRFYLQVWVFYCCCSMEQIQDSQSSVQDQNYSTHKGHRSNSGF
jgi:hypothetical protein